MAKRKIPYGTKSPVILTLKGRIMGTTSSEGGKMTGKKIFVEPELIKYEESLDEVTLAPAGSSETNI
jgi:hypothetical protein